MLLSTSQYGFIIDPMVPFTDASGTTIRNGYVRVFVAGSSTPVITYKNYDGATNEETIQLDNSGRTAYPVIVSKGNTYKVCVYDAEHSQESPILTIDKVVPAGANVEATNIVTGLDNVESPEAGWVKSTVSGTDAEVSLDATNVTSEVDTMVKATSASADYMMPLVHKTGSDPDKKITLGNIFKFVLNFIHSLTDTAAESDIASGNYFALDGSAGTKKLNSTTLLTKTAQNALAGNVAPAFIPSVTNAKAGMPYIYEGALYVAKIDYQGAWNASLFNRLDFPSLCLLKKGSITSLTGSAPYNNLNTFPINEICFCPSNFGTVANKPVDSGFTVTTLSGQTGTVTQIFSSSSKKTYIRSSWGSNWGDWVEIKNFVYEGIANKGLLSTATAPYNNLNTFPVNEIVTMTTAGADVSNRPDTNTQFSVMTFGGLASTKTQICSMSSGRTYIRSTWGGTTWTEWVQVKKYDSSDFEQINPILYFDNIVCIGDSLTYSQVYTGESSSRQAKKTWPQMLAKLCGVTQTTYAVAGDTATTSWARYKDVLMSKENALAIIYLGTNLGFTDTLSTDAPENTDPSTWADTNTGCLAKYCDKLTTLGYKIALVKPWATGGGADLATTQSVIDQVGARFSCCVVESFKTLEEKYHKWPNLEGLNSLHYNDLGYSWFASVLPEKLAESSTLAKILPTT